MLTGTWGASLSTDHVDTLTWQGAHDEPSLDTHRPPHPHAGPWPCVPDRGSQQLSPSRPVLPRVVATVMSLDPRGLATIQTIDGARYEVVTGTGWRIGDTVECEHNERTRVPWETLGCRKAS
jgi:hypothetical protein